jgi:formate C-acetyltransferase
MIGSFLHADLQAGKITLDEAREYLAHFFIKGCEWIRGGESGSGDAQHYQNILLAGINADGAEITNEATYLVLDIIEELGISDFPITVRVNKNTDEKLLNRAAEVIRHGGGVIAVYNEDLIIDSLVNVMGYDVKEARNFANDGCWEVQVPGKTRFIYIPFDSLKLLQSATLKDYDKNQVDFQDFESLYNAYIADLNETVDSIYENCMRGVKSGDKQNGFIWHQTTPCTVVSLFEEGCAEKGLMYFEGGPVYSVFSPHIGGLPDTANALYAIKKFVFDEKKLTFGEFMDVLKNDWQGYEQYRRYILTQYEYFGNTAMNPTAWLRGY